MATLKIAYGAHNALTITNLNSLASSATAGWQSAVISNLTDLVDDFEIFVKLTMANTAPANDQAVYIFICPVYNDGSTDYYSDGGTTTLPSGVEGTYTIARPTDLRQIGILSYTTQNMVLQGRFLVSNAGQAMPDKFSIIIINYTGAAIAASGNLVAYKEITYTVS